MSVPSFGHRIVGLALFSGLLSGLSLFVEPLGTYAGPGILYGLMVLLPCCRLANVSVPNMVVSVISSTVAYYAAVRLFLEAECPALLCGAIGALATTSLLLSLGFRASIGLFYVVVAGTLAGYVDGLMITLLPSDDFWWTFKMTGVMVVWQVTTAVALVYALRPAVVPPSMSSPHSNPA